MPVSASISAGPTWRMSATDPRAAMISAWATSWLPNQWSPLPWVLTTVAIGAVAVSGVSASSMVSVSRRS